MGGDSGQALRGQPTCQELGSQQILLFCPSCFSVTGGQLPRLGNMLQTAVFVILMPHTNSSISDTQKDRLRLEGTGAEL